MENLYERVMNDSPAHMLEIAADCSMLINNNVNFIIENITTHNTNINVFDVNGTEHQDYTNLSWLDILQKAKRIKRNLKECSDKPEYYFRKDDHNKQIYYTSIDDLLFIDGEGNHRTTIAKALFHYYNRTDLHGVTVSKIKIDYELKNNIELIKTSDKFSQYGFHPQYSLFFMSEQAPKERKHNIEIERKKIYVTITNNQRTKLFLDAHGAREFYEELESYSWASRIVPLNKYAKFINGNYSISKMVKDTYKRLNNH